MQGRWCRLIETIGNGWPGSAEGGWQPDQGAEARPGSGAQRPEKPSQQPSGPHQGPCPAKSVGACSALTLIPDGSHGQLGMMPLLVISPSLANIYSLGHTHMQQHALHRLPTITKL